MSRNQQLLIKNSVLTLSVVYLTSLYYQYFSYFSTQDRLTSILNVFSSSIYLVMITLGFVVTHYIIIRNSRHNVILSIGFFGFGLYQQITTNIQLGSFGNSSLDFTVISSLYVRPCILFAIFVLLLVWRKKRNDNIEKMQENSIDLIPESIQKTMRNCLIPMVLLWIGIIGLTNYMIFEVLRFMDVVFSILPIFLILLIVFVGTKYSKSTIVFFQLLTACCYVLSIGWMYDIIIDVRMMFNHITYTDVILVIISGLKLILLLLLIVSNTLVYSKLKKIRLRKENKDLLDTL